jgi:hypothetical protein
MTRTELENLIQRKANIITLWTKTEPSMSAEGKRKFPGLKKLTKVNGITGYDYQRLLDKTNQSRGLPIEAAKPRKWGVRDGKLVRHNGKTYIPIFVRSAKATYTLNDKEIPFEAVKEFLRKNDSDIPVVEYNLDNVVGVTVNHDFVEIEDKHEDV